MGVVLQSAKDSGFIAGADVTEFDDMSDPGVLTGGAQADAYADATASRR